MRRELAPRAPPHERVLGRDEPAVDEGPQEDRGPERGERGGGARARMPRRGVGEDAAVDRGARDEDPERHDGEDEDLVEELEEDGGPRPEERARAADALKAHDRLVERRQEADALGEEDEPVEARDLARRLVGRRERKGQAERQEDEEDRDVVADDVVARRAAPAQRHDAQRLDREKVPGVGHRDGRGHGPERAEARADGAARIEAQPDAHHRLHPDAPVEDRRHQAHRVRAERCAAATAHAEPPQTHAHRARRNGVAKLRDKRQLAERALPGGTPTRDLG